MRLLLLCGSLGGTFLITTNVIDYCIIINLRFVWTIFRVILQQPDHGELFRIWTFLVWSVCSALTSLQQRGPYSPPKFNLHRHQVRSISDLDSKTGDRCRDGNRCAGCCHMEGPVVVGWVSGTWCLERWGQKMFVVCVCVFYELLGEKWKWWLMIFTFWAACSFNAGGDWYWARGRSNAHTDAVLYFLFSSDSWN